MFGGIRTLRHTEVIIFESHRLWANHTTVGLQNLVRWLWQLGYFTFLIGKPCLIKLWGSHQKVLGMPRMYNRLQQWSNCIALRRSSPLYPVLMLWTCCNVCQRYPCIGVESRFMTRGQGPH
uniref:Uncharacterized protein n=1 Tax=Eutreptiella gymnastica TaxID=73025 RepID=A0A7S4D2Z3_9EUGL